MGNRNASGIAQLEEFFKAPERLERRGGVLVPIRPESAETSKAAPAPEPTPVPAERWD